MTIDYSQASAFKALGFTEEERIAFIEKFLKASTPEGNLTTSAEKFIPTLTEKELNWLAITSIKGFLKRVSELKGAMHVLKMTDEQILNQFKRQLK